MRREKKDKLSKGAASGMVALVFLILGFQLAIFIMKAVERPPRSELSEIDDSRSSQEGTQPYAEVASEPSAPVGTIASEAAGGPSSREHFSARGTKTRSRDATGTKTRSHDATGTEEAEPTTRLGGYARPGSAQPGNARSGYARPGQGTATKHRSYENFAFDPNTVTVEDLQRLGLSQRQAESIENYRSKGGRFRSKSDFQKMYVVSDTLFARLEPFIEIPRLELNGADSTALVSLRGIGPWYAKKIIDYRERLGGFVDKSQLLEIGGMDAERYAGLEDAVTADPGKIRRLDIWHAADSLLARHPYIGEKGARSIVRFRQLYDSTRWTVADLASEKALSAENIEKLKKYIENQ